MHPFESEQARGSPKLAACAAPEAPSEPDTPADETCVGGQRQECCAHWGSGESEVRTRMRVRPKTRPNRRAKGVMDPRFAWARSPADMTGKSQLSTSLASA